MAIDVGSACDGRPDKIGASYTVIAYENSSNDTGTIHTICIYAVVGNNISGLQYGAFTDEGSNVFTCAAGHYSIEDDLTATEQTTHTAAGNDFTAFNISTGEYIGCYYSGGQLERSYDAGLARYIVGDNIPGSSVTFNSLTGPVSIYATGTEAAAGVAPTAALYGPLVGPFGGPMGPMGGRL